MKKFLSISLIFLYCSCLLFYFSPDVISYLFSYFMVFQLNMLCFEACRSLENAVVLFAFIILVLNYCLPSIFSKRTSGFDMAPPAAAVVPGAAVPGLHPNSCKYTY